MSQLRTRGDGLGLGVVNVIERRPRATRVDDLSAGPRSKVDLLRARDHGFVVVLAPTKQLAQSDGVPAETIELPRPSVLAFASDHCWIIPRCRSMEVDSSVDLDRRNLPKTRVTGKGLCLFKVMFYSPRIAPNTGNAIRMVAATGCELHLVEPLGFDLSEPKLRRAGLDYHDLASVTVHRDLHAAWDALTPERVYAFTAHATASFADVAYRPDDVLMFGPEPTGLDATTLADAHITAQLRIPMLAGRRSLNLSNAAAVVVYEAWRQHGFIGGM